MVGPAAIRPGIFLVGAVDWDRRLFDSLIPIPDGTSYNSYLVQGSEKTALLDTVDPSMERVLLGHLSQLGIQKIDYIVAHHAEQDHSGSLSAVIKLFPQAKIVTNTRCKAMLLDLLHITDAQFIEVQDGDTLSLGNRTLKFVFTPWVHWPETMSTYLVEEKILFSCDFFGSHLATSDLYVTDEGRTYEEAKRYYAEIMMPFHTSIEKNLEKLRDYDIKIIAPSHGPLYNHPEFILNLYHDWVFNEPSNIAVIAFVSMHGSTQKMVNYLTESLSSKGVEVKQVNLPVTDIGKLAMSLVDAATVIIGTPTVLAGPHPDAAFAAFLTNALRPKVKYVSVIGSYLWGGKTVDVIKGLLPNVKAEILDPVLVKGLPGETDYAGLEKLAETIAQKHQSLSKSSEWRITKEQQ